MYKYRWTHKNLKDVNGCNIIKTTDNETKVITYDVYTKDGMQKHFSTLKEARNYAENYISLDEARILAKIKMLKAEIKQLELQLSKCK